MKKQVIGTDISINLLSLDVYKGDELIAEMENGEGKEFTVNFNGKDYQVTNEIIYLLAAYGIDPAFLNGEFLTNLAYRPVIHKLGEKQISIDRIPILMSPVEREGYRWIPAYPDYEIDASGVLRNYHTKAYLDVKTHKAGEPAVYHISCVKTGIACDVPLRWLVNLVWSESPGCFTINTEETHFTVYPED